MIRVSNSSLNTTFNKSMTTYFNRVTDPKPLQRLAQIFHLYACFSINLKSENLKLAKLPTACYKLTLKLMLQFVSSASFWLFTSQENSCSFLIPVKDIVFLFSSHKISEPIFVYYKVIGLT